MQRINRSAHAPVGTAVFLFVGLAILPLSLRATGVQISINPRLSAATEAWQHIADVFGAGYQATSVLSVVRDIDPDPSTQIESAESLGRTQFACAGKAQDAQETVRAVAEEPSASAVPVRRSSSRSASRRSLPVGQAATMIAAEALNAGFEKEATILGAIGALKVATINREGLLKGLDKRLFDFSFEPMIDVRNPTGMKNIRVVVRPRAVAGSTTKTAERKVFSAMASARRRECDRAILTGMITGTPDHSEF